MKCLPALASLTIAAASAHAAPTLSVVPEAGTVKVGSSLVVDLTISGLTGPLALGTYDVNVTFDPAVLTFSSAAFGDQLDLFGLGDIQTITPGAGVVDLFELSLDSPADLGDLQANSFRLATLTFNAVTVSAGTPISLAVNALGDANGDAISSTNDNGEVVVTPSIAEVPEPALGSLLLVGLSIIGGAGLASRRSRTRDKD